MSCSSGSSVAEEIGDGERNGVRSSNNIELSITLFRVFDPIEFLYSTIFKTEILTGATDLLPSMLESPEKEGS